MSVTRDDLVALVNLELENSTRRGSGQAEADGVLKVFLVAPHGYNVVDNANFLVYLDSVATTDYTMDFTNGLCTMNATPASGVIVSFLYDYVYWPDEVVIEAINAGVSSLFPSFYLNTVDETIAATGDDYEYALPDDAEYVCGVSFRTDSTSPWKRYRRENRFEVIKNGTDNTIRFYTPPGDGTLRVQYISRPVEMMNTDPVALTVSGISVASASVITTTTAHGFSTGDLVYFSAVSTTPQINLTYQVVTVIDATSFSIPVAVTNVTDQSGSVVFVDSLETTCGLPARASHPIVSYACFYLLTQKVAPRIRSDVAIVTQGRGNLSPRQMNDAANSFYLRYQMQMTNYRMSPWSQR